MLLFKKVMDNIVDFYKINCKNKNTTKATNSWLRTYKHILILLLLSFILVLLLLSFILVLLLLSFILVLLLLSFWTIIIFLLLVPLTFLIIWIWITNTMTNHTLDIHDLNYTRHWQLRKHTHRYNNTNDRWEGPV